MTKRGVDSVKKEENFEQKRFRSEMNVVDRSNFPKTFPKHWHQYVELIAVPVDAGEEVRGRIQVNQECYDLYAGDLLFIWPGELHEVVNNEKSMLAALQFPITELTQRKEFALYVNLFKKYHHLSAREYPELVQNMMFSMQQILIISKEDKQFHEVRMLLCLYEMMIELGEYINRNLALADSVEHRDKQMLEKIHAACEYIQENCETNLTLEKVAEYIGFSPCYFSRSFKRVTTYHFVEYLLIQRVKKLQILLADDEMSITEAAYQAGFKSLSTLNRVFKLYCGCAPREYKKYYTR